jgi:hypothetical protein
VRACVRVEVVRLGLRVPPVRHVCPAQALQTPPPPPQPHMHTHALMRATRLKRTPPRRAHHPP